MTRRIAGLALVLAAGWGTGPIVAQDLPYRVTHEHVQTGDAARIRVLSSHNALVTGGDALVEIESAAGAGVPTVLLNGRDTSSSFAPATAPSTWRGLVMGLSLGDNLIEVRDARRGEATLTLTNWPAQGPVLTGVHQQPFICMTDQFTLPVTGGTLGPPLTTDCDVPTRVDYIYRTEAGPFRALGSATERPSDMSELTTAAGTRVPFVVRVETGVVNRAIYQIAMLELPGAWNGGLVYQFGGGCPGGMYIQGSRTGGVLEPEMLSRGYAMASSTLNVFGNNCDDLLAAETMMMVKERFVERFAPPAYTLGWGCSGGSYQAEQIADNYPGLLDGIVVGCSFPDVGHAAVSVHSFGAKLMLRYYGDMKGVPWTADQIVAASGLPDFRTLEAQGGRGDRIDPSEPCNEALPRSGMYDATSNPGGVRCSIYDHGAVGFGRDPATGFARRPLDNVGVQYGLVALNARQISKAQFIDLNQRIGGIDIDARYTPERTTGDPIALRRAYQTGRFLSGGGGLAAVPIIDVRQYTDFANGDPHQSFHSFSLRERLKQANGHADNMVMLRESNVHGLFSLRSPVVREALDRMGEWIRAIKADASERSAPQKVLAAKPPQLVDACFKDNGTRIAEPQVYQGDTACNQLFQAHGNPYIAAGAPVANNVTKCALKPIDPADYSVVFNAEELAALAEVFPQGVCDYTRPGVEQQPLLGTWLAFGPRIPQ